jgi:hypothetical protein
LIPPFGASSPERYCYYPPFLPPLLIALAIPPLVGACVLNQSKDSKSGEYGLSTFDVPATGKLRRLRFLNLHLLDRGNISVHVQALGASQSITPCLNQTGEVKLTSEPLVVTQVASVVDIFLRLIPKPFIGPHLLTIIVSDAQGLRAKFEREICSANPKHATMKSTKKHFKSAPLEALFLDGEGFFLYPCEAGIIMRNR